MWFVFLGSLQEVPENPLRHVKYSINFVLDDNDILRIEAEGVNGTKIRLIPMDMHSLDISILLKEWYF
jgi:hypothetical protein